MIACQRYLLFAWAQGSLTPIPDCFDLSRLIEWHEANIIYLTAIAVARTTSPQFYSARACSRSHYPGIARVVPSGAQSCKCL